MSHLRLQKLLYYVQGWSLAIRQVPMFHDRIEAWAHGPVVRDLFPHFANYTSQPIPAVVPPQNLTREEEGFIELVWEEYKGYSALALRRMTHEEKPWIDARAGCGPADRCTNEITKDAMKAFFVAAANESD